MNTTDADEGCDGKRRIGEFDCLGCDLCARYVEKRARFAELREHRRAKEEDAKAKVATIPPAPESEVRPVRERGPATVRDAFAEEMDRLDMQAFLCWA